MSDLDEMIAGDISSRLKAAEQTKAVAPQIKSSGGKLIEREEKQIDKDKPQHADIICRDPLNHHGLAWRDCYARWHCLACTSPEIDVEAMGRRLYDRLTECVVWPLRGCGER